MTDSAGLAPTVGASLAGAQFPPQRPLPPDIPVLDPSKPVLSLSKGPGNPRVLAHRVASPIYE